MQADSSSSSNNSLLLVDPNAVQQLTVLLSALTHPDTQAIRHAEQQLKPILKNKDSMAVLWSIISNINNDPGVRHVSAIVLRKRLPAHYSTSFNPELKQQWQQAVLQCLANEQIRPVRAGLIGVAAALAHVEGPARPQLYLDFLAAAASDPNPAARELCFLLLVEMTDTIGQHYRPHANALAQLFASVLHNPQEVPAVQKAAVNALGQLLSFWAEEPDEIVGLAPLLPVLLQVAARHTQPGNIDEDFLATVLDVLYDLAYSTSTALLPHLPVTIEFALTCLQSADLEVRVRDAAALVIATTAEAKPKTLGRQEALLGRVLDSLFQLMQDSPESAAGALFESNPSWRQDLEQDGTIDKDDDADFDTPTETSMAQGTLDMLACELPKRYIWQPALTRCLERMASPDPNARKAGVAGLGVIAEGCHEPMTSSLPNVLPYVFNAAQDPSHQVRECACFCLGQLSEHCQPDILQYNEQILPIVFALLDDGSVAVQATSCYVLEMFCERLEPSAVRPVLDPLVRKLAAMLEVTTKRSVQEMAVAALAATAVAAESEFIPYMAGVATLMTKLMLLNQESQYTLRGRALECMGHMAIAVGRDTFRPYFAATMQCAMEGLTVDSTDLQEFAYAVFANLAKVMMDEFAPALPDLVPFLVKVIEQDEGKFEKSGDSDDEGGSTGRFSGLDDSDDDNESGNMVLHVRTALLEVKKGAITALGEMAAHTGTNFFPFIEQTLEVLQKAAKNWHPLIKTEVAEVLPSLVVPSIAAYHNGEMEWKKADVTGLYPLSPHTAAIVNAVITELITLAKDEEKTVVSKALDSIQSLIELCGPQSLLPALNEILTLTHQILVKVSPCQTAEAMYGELPDDDDDQDVVTQGAFDLIGAMCRVLGSHFVQYLPQFLPIIVDYTQQTHPPFDRYNSVGCLSEIAQELDGAIYEHWKTVFLPCSIAGLGDTEDNVQRNAAFCAGMCAEKLGEQIVNDYPAILQALSPLFAMNNADPTDSGAAVCVDNAVAAICRMIMASPSHVPLAQVLPVMLSALPLKKDMVENDTVYTCLLGLLQMNHPDVQPNIVAEIQKLFRLAITEDSPVKDEMKERLRNALQAMNA